MLFLFESNINADAKNPIAIPKILPPKTSESQCSPKDILVKPISPPNPVRRKINIYLKVKLIFEKKTRHDKIVTINIVLVICPEG